MGESTCGSGNPGEGAITEVQDGNVGGWSSIAMNFFRSNPTVSTLEALSMPERAHCQKSEAWYQP